MAAYFARRLIGGVITLFLAGLLMYSLVIYSPGGVFNRPIDFDECMSCTTKAWSDLTSALDQQNVSEWGVDNPWPLSYLSWLLNPSRTTRVQADYKNGVLQGPIDVPYGMDINLFGMHLQGSGLLVSGNLLSREIMRRVLVTDMLGPSFGVFMLFLPLTLLAAMTLVLVQRWRRPNIGEVSFRAQESGLVNEYRQRIGFSWL